MLIDDRHHHLMIITCNHMVGNFCKPSKDHTYIRHMCIIVSRTYLKNNELLLVFVFVFVFVDIFVFLEKSEGQAGSPWQRGWIPGTRRTRPLASLAPAPVFVPMYLYLYQCTCICTNVFCICISRKTVVKVCNGGNLQCIYRAQVQSLISTLGLKANSSNFTKTFLAYLLIRSFYID